MARLPPAISTTFSGIFQKPLVCLEKSNAWRISRRVIFAIPKKMAHQEEFTDLTATQLTGCQQAETNPEITLSTASPEQWIFAPIAVIIQQMSLKKPPSAPAPLKPETNLSFCLQTLIPFLFAGLGLIFAGLLLEDAETWSFFIELPDAVTLVPTLANLGFMETPKQKWQVALSNMALIQTQAIVVSSIAVIPAALLGEKPMNPDNITTPVAASLGDVSTLFILLGLGSVLLRVREHYCWALVLILLCFYVFAVACAYKASEDHFTVEVVILLYICQFLVRAMWRLRIDPDSSAIPVLTAAGDLLGAVLLIGCFWLAANAYGMHVDESIHSPNNNGTDWIRIGPVIIADCSTTDGH
ncbi:hypothetical protein TELCIR_08692 [Teladorsagia circumcincta]|uniref:SLC41A/MgtE integral membrane domain-containing protein n=1 Tax=Teladorsagia circumcincta TaxID=45464 RepID=A0A2G9UJ10_TELCI|nr:hypothetical protein TELCIR_08692 [Teladorsagia circumcincta]